jgi:predicted ATPase
VYSAPKVYFSAAITRAVGTGARRNFASYLESVGSTFMAYAGKSLHHQSHGESFLALFQHRFEDGLYLLDEPEAALSPQRQLAFLTVLHELTAKKVAQFVIATHSPHAAHLPRRHDPESRPRGDPTSDLSEH